VEHSWSLELFYIPGVPFSDIGAGRYTVSDGHEMRGLGTAEIFFFWNGTRVYSRGREFTLAAERQDPDFLIGPRNEKQRKTTKKKDRPLKFVIHHSKLQAGTSDDYHHT
jgi:hypothetical protein